MTPLTGRFDDDGFPIAEAQGCADIRRMERLTKTPSRLWKPADAEFARTFLAENLTLILKSGGISDGEQS